MTRRMPVLCVLIQEQHLLENNRDSETVVQSSNDADQLLVIEETAVNQSVHAFSQTQGSLSGCVADACHARTRFERVKAGLSLP